MNKAHEELSLSTLPTASVLIRTYNEEQHLPRLLDALDQQSFKDFETIVVDSGSADRTPHIARNRATCLIEIESRDFTFGYSLNVGMKAARGQFVAIVSAHAFPTTANWLSLLIEPLKLPRAAMVYGRQLGLPASKFSERLDFERFFGSRPRRHTPADAFANNANSAVLRERWLEFPFDETLPGLEDIHWARHWTALGYDVVYEPGAAVHHLHEESWRQVRRRYYREAVAARWIGLKPRRHLPLDVARESAYLAADLLKAAHEGRLLASAGEIARFRLAKTFGTVQGVLDGAGFADERTRDNMFFDRTGKAVVIKGPGHASLEEVSIPVPKPGDVLIRVAFEGICGTDLEVLHGTLSYYKEKRAKYPIVPGHEFSGYVTMVGPNVSACRVGDRVVVECIQTCRRCPDCRRNNFAACSQRREVGVIGQDGGYAEFVLVPGEFVHRVPDDIPLDRAAICEPLAVVIKGIKRLSRSWDPGVGHRCLVVGAGAIGHLTARVLHLRGHQVSVYDRDASRRHAFAGSDIDVIDSLADVTAYDALIEATGDPGALDVMLHGSRPGATILLLGLPYGRREYSFDDVVSYDKTVVGSVGSGAEEFEEALRLLRELDLNHFFGARFQLQQFEAAWHEFRQRRAVKILLEIATDG